MKVAYLSGPIAGQPELNEPLFRAAAQKLLKENKFRRDNDRILRVVVPHDIPPTVHVGECPPSYVKNGEHTAACYLREDLIFMLQDCSDVWFLPGWEASVGARLEMQVAAACGLELHFFTRLELGCAHNNFARGRCDEPTCWHYRKPLDQVHTREELMALRSPGEPVTIHAPALGVPFKCAHKLRLGTTYCDTSHCPNYYGRAI